MSLDRSLAPRWIRHPSHSADDSCTWSVIVWDTGGSCCERKGGRKEGRRTTQEEEDDGDGGDECKEDARGIN